jgi:hypothetical protein
MLSVSASTMAPARVALRQARQALVQGRMLAAQQHSASRVECRKLRTAVSGAASLLMARRTSVLVGLAVSGSLGARAMAAGGSLPAPPDVAKPPANAQFTPSGLATLVIKPGTGAHRKLTRR